MFLITLYSDIEYCHEFNYEHNLTVLITYIKLFLKNNVEDLVFSLSSPTVIHGHAKEKLLNRRKTTE